ncbi:uncharacterized protein LOC132161987 isoform X2 [Corylus avellana]|uniref:uncharacterized protein LOC132161987 isoform X2 n=1 Tax=Corylus avellana TaxID=13451 RepID=UPI00286A4E7F|nr:uncharacterized protein LOC132161987 isoform X2 [Corylus avellana]
MHVFVSERHRIMGCGKSKSKDPVVHQKNVLTSCSTTRSKGDKNGAPEKDMMPRADEEKPVREEHDVLEKEKLIAVEKPDSDDDEIETYYSAEDEEPEPEDEEPF